MGLACGNRWQLLQTISFATACFRIRVCLTPDIVNFPPGNFVDALINPANEFLTGTRLFSYFPRGGPVPIRKSVETESARWGGMEAGYNMIYPAQTVDGLVHLAGGADLASVITALPTTAGGLKCGTGDAVVTDACGKLSDRFRYIIHTATPFHSSKNWSTNLASCYDSSLTVASRLRCQSIATPLLGAGCKGIPEKDAVLIAVQACSKWARDHEHEPVVLHLCLQSTLTAPLFDHVLSTVPGTEVVEDRLS